MKEKLTLNPKTRYNTRFQCAFIACCCVFKEITLVASNQRNYFENVNAFLYFALESYYRGIYRNIQSNLCTTITFGTQKQWQLLTGGCCSEVIHAIKVQNETSKYWPLQTGGHYLEVVVCSGLTVYQNSETAICFYSTLEVN